MLKLKKIQVLGFKSFADRTELCLEGDGLAAVVGPNGCGKSNISDAITWVLGEQSAKSLRGAKMEDVIFAGTAGRKPTGMAEVSLTLVDPEVYDGHDRHRDGPELVVAERRAPGHLPEDWSEEDLRRRRAEETEEAVAEAQPGMVLTGEAGEEPASAAPDPSGDAASADAVVLRVRRRSFQRAPVRAGEITVTRRLFRTGESEYLLNGKICRMRDIQDIFLGTGLGGESYAIIGQERIGQMLSSKPLDRRAIIEEAAGITRFKTKKRLAELRLDSARQNLARVNDIFEEVSRQLGSLKRQAAKAERYSALRDELRAKLRVVLSSRLSQMETEQKQAQAALDSLHAEVDQRAHHIEEEDRSHAAAMQRGYALDEAARAAGQEASELAVMLERIASRLAGNADRAAELDSRTATAVVDLDDARRQHALLAAEAEQHRSFLAAAEDETAAAREIAAQKEAEARSAAQKTVDAEAESEHRRREMLSLLQRAAQFRKEQAQAEEALAALGREQGRLQLESEAARADLEALGLQRGQARLSFESTSDRLAGLEAELGRLRLDLEEKRSAEADHRRQGDALRRELAAVHGSRSSLEALLQDHSFSTDTVKELLRRARQQAEGDSERLPIGTLADLLEVEGGVGKAIDDLLRDELDYIVVPGWAAADACADLLRTEIAGRATLLVHAAGNAEGTDTPAVEPVADLPGTSRVLDHVRHAAGLDALVRRLPKLRNGFITETGEQARHLAAAHPAGWFVTPEGEVYHGASVTAGRSAVGGPLALKRDLREATARAVALERQAAQCETETATLVHQIAERTATMEAQSAARREAEREAANSGAALQQMDSDAARIERRLADWQLASERNRDQRTAKLDLIAGHAEAAEALDRERTELNASLDTLQAAQHDLRRLREELQHAASAAAAQVAALEERRRNAKGSADQTERMLGAQATRIQQLETLIAAATAEKERRTEETASLSAQQQEFTSRQTQAKRQVQTLAEESAALRKRLETLDHVLRAARAELEELRQRRSDFAVRSARLDAEREHLEASCRTDLGCEPADLRSDTTVISLSGDALAESEAECLALKQRLETMGPVNMMALEEFTEASGRHGFLETQRADLLASIENTQASIREIDEVSRTKFEEAFEAINSNFSVAFAKLFAGGHATMKLTDADNAAESGIDIVTAPPGKKPQNILLLSGGEKALTALGLLVAIFRYQPAPFCVLDEVDAPLDEVNVGRFTRLLAEMAASTQFIVITHSKRTMQAADVIYGVTMQEPGVSRIVSVNLGERRTDQDRRRAVA